MNAMKLVNKLFTRKNILIALFVVGVAAAIYIVMQPTRLPGMELFTEKKEDGEECEENSDCQSDNCKEGACQPSEEEFENHEEADEKENDQEETVEGFGNMEQGELDAKRTLENPHIAMMANQNNPLEAFDGMDSSFFSLGNGKMKNNKSNPASCFPRDSLEPGELMPKEGNNEFSAFAPMGQGDISQRNFLEAGHHIGINTVGSSMKNGNRSLRSDPPIKRIPVSVFNNSTIEPDIHRRYLEVGSAVEN
jgi:hypothetical protein